MGFLIEYQMGPLIEKYLDYINYIFVNRVIRFSIINVQSLVSIFMIGFHYFK